MEIKKNAVDRLREPSTWAGIAALAAMFNVPADGVAVVGQVVMGLAGLLAMFLPEKLK